MSRIGLSLAMVMSLVVSTAWAGEEGGAPATPAKTATVLKSTGQERVRMVYHLQAVPASDMAKTLNELLLNERTLRQAEQKASADASAEDVIVLPEPISNSLVLSGSSEAMGEVRQLVEQLDRPARMVLLEMVLGEAPRDASKPAAEKDATKASEDGLVRLLEAPPQMENVARLRLTALDNQPAFVQLGAKLPRITGTTVSSAGQANQVTMENVGLILGVTPRVAPDGTVLLKIDAERSQPGPENEGVPLASAGGTVTRSPRIDTLTVQTTVSVANGQTLVLASAARQGSPGKELVILVTPHLMNVGGK